MRMSRVILFCRHAIVVALAPMRKKENFHRMTINMVKSVGIIFMYLFIPKQFNVEHAIGVWSLVLNQDSSSFQKVCIKLHSQKRCKRLSVSRSQKVHLSDGLENSHDFGLSVTNQYDRGVKIIITFVS